jgi:DNA-binding GntR family transcriptional regulator
VAVSGWAFQPGGLDRARSYTTSGASRAGGRRERGRGNFLYDLRCGTAAKRAIMPTSKHEYAYRIIKSRILDGTYEPGSRLVLDGLARQLDVSPVPVREAIRRLEAEGWVRFQHNVGAQVAPFDASEWEQTMHTLALLEGYATALAAPNMRPHDLDVARGLNGQMREALASPLDAQRFTSLNREFHFVFCERCENEYLKGLLREAWDRLDVIRRSIFLFIPLRAQASVEEHDALIALVRERASAAEIELAAREHKLHTVNAYLASKAAGARPPARRRKGVAP